MGASMELTTLSRVQAYLGLNGSDEVRDGLLQRLIAAVSEAVENHCNREFAQLRRVEFHDGQGAASLSLRCRPVQEVFAVHDDPARIFADGSRLPASAWVLYEKEGLLRLQGMRLCEGRKNVRVEYTAGYLSVPPAVEQAAIALVAHFYTRANNGADAIASESLGVYSVSYDTGQWPAQVRGLLSEFRECNI